MIQFLTNCILTSLLLALPVVTADRFDVSEKTYLDGLRNRQLYDIAEFYCIESLQRDDLSVTDQAALTVELVQSRAAQATIATTQTRSEAWRLVWDTQTEFESKFPKHPKSILVTLQVALSRLSYATVIQQELNAEMISPSEIKTSRDTMLAELRNARRTFEQIENDIQRSLPQQRVKTTTNDEFSADELIAIQKNVRFQLARCQLQTAYGYDATDTLNRTSIISDVLQRITEVQNSVSPQQRLWWLSKIVQVECLRLVGRNLDAAQSLNNLPLDDRPLDLAGDLLEQRLLLILERRDVMGAEKYLQQSRAKRLSYQSPQMDIAQLRAAVMLSQNTDSDAAKKKWLNRASEMIADIERRHGGYWSRRAALALIKATGLTPSALPSANASLPMSAAPSKSPLDRTSDLILDGQREIMIQTAQRAVRQNNHNDAVKAWQRAIDLTAPDSADRQRLLISLSKSYESLKQPAQAARFLIDGANQTPTTANAAAMHLRGCWNLARSTTTDSSSNQSTSKLIDALKQHLQRWPRSETVDQATLWLVAEYQQRQQFDEALQTMVGAGTMSQSIVRQFRNTFFLAKKEWHDAPRRIQNLAQKIVSHFDQQWTAIEDSSVAQDLTATAAEIGLASECLTLNEISEWIVRHSSRFTINRKSEIQLYRALLIALLDEDLLRCEQIFLNMAPSEAQCRSILALAKQQPVNHPDLQMASDQFGFLVTQQALKQPLSVQQTTAWRFEQAKFLAATGQTERSLSLLTPLAQQFKSDRSIQIQYARALSKIPDRGADALTAWRLLAQRLPPKSENWYEAKFNVAQGLAKKKQPDAAKQVLKYVQALYGWRGSEWAKPIEQLLRSL